MSFFKIELDIEPDEERAIIDGLYVDIIAETQYDDRPISTNISQNNDNQNNVGKSNSAQNNHKQSNSNQRNANQSSTGSFVHPDQDDEL